MFKGHRIIRRRGHNYLDSRPLKHGERLYLKTPAGWVGGTFESSPPSAETALVMDSDGATPQRIPLTRTDDAGAIVPLDHLLASPHQLEKLNIQPIPPGTVGSP